MTPAAGAAGSVGSVGSEGALVAHQLHLLMLLGVWAVLLAVWQLAERARTRRRERGEQPGPLLPGLQSSGLALVAAATAGSGLVHLAVAPEHLGEGLLYGGFLLVLGGLQVAWSLALLHRPGLGLLRLGGAVSAGVVVLWVETRLVGSGLGPLPAGRQAFGLLDVTATAAELAVVVSALAITRVPTPDRRGHPPDVAQDAAQDAAQVAAQIAAQGSR